MQEIAEFWNSLGVAGQGVVLGLVTSGVVAFFQWVWPSLVIVPNDVKRVIIVLMAGITTYAVSGDVGAAVAAAMSAFGAYHLSEKKRNGG